ncbi:MAG: SO_0444 family Cu/Zn efflux transporter [Magnetococcus sp. YQC-5]
MIFFDNLVHVTLEMAPWLVLGLVAAGLVKAWIPESLVMRWLGGQGIWPIFRAAIIGAPLPLCSCSVIPMAIGLRRNGASKSSTVSFLVATPETGVDSLALSWIMLGPFMTIARPVCAILSAMFSGMLTLLVERFEANHLQDSLVSNPLDTHSEQKCASSCCSKNKKLVVSVPPTAWTRTIEGIQYAMRELWDDIALLLGIGLILTAAVTTWVPYGNLSSYTQESWLSMILIVIASMPVYVCATASTPMAAAMLFSGMTPGMALAFLMAGPATNVAPLGIIKRELGSRVLAAYLTGIFVSSVGLGMLADLIARHWGWMPEVNLTHQNTEWMPVWLAASSAVFLLALSFRPLWKSQKQNPGG